jgi:Mce-associated membrane protein
VADEIVDEPVVSTSDTTRRLLWIGVAALVVAVAFAGWAGFSWWRAADDDALRYAQARDDVLAAGRAHVTLVTTLDYHDIDGGIAGWLKVSTGPLREELSHTDERTKTTLREAGTVATGRVLDAAVSELDERAGTAKLLVSVEIATQQKDGATATKRNRFVVGMSRLDGEWKLSALDQVPLGAQ